MNSSSKNLQVLLVEDSENDALLTLRELKQGGFEPDHLRVDTRTALEQALKDRTWDVILSDYKMPGFNGAEALKVVQESGQDIPFILISGTIGEETAVAMMKAGAHDFLLKDALGLLVPAIERELKEADVRREKRQQEAFLQKSERNLKKAEKIAKLGNWEWNILTSELYWSDEVFRIYGADPKTVKPSYDIVVSTGAPECRDRFAQAVEDALKHDKPFEGEYRLIGLDGKERFIHAVGEVVRDRNGRPVSMFGIVRDITKRKRIEESLRKAERLYHELVETAQDLIWQCDAEGRYIYLNAAWEEVFGYGLEEMLGKKFTDFQDPDTARRDVETFSRLLQAGAVSKYETVHRSKNGRDIHLVFNAKLVQDEHGKIIGTRGTAYDITERKRAEAELQKSEARLKEAQRIARIGNWTFDARSGSLWWSEELYRMYGLAPATASLQPEDVIGRIHPEDREVFKKEVASGLPRRTDYRIALPDGTVKYIHEEVQVHRDPGGTVTRYTGTAQDITERRSAEQALRDTKELLALFLRHSPIYAFIKEVTPAESRVLQASENFHEMIGIAGSDMKGKAMSELFPPEFAAKITADDWAVASSGEVLKLDEELNGRSYTTIKFPLFTGGRTLLAGYTIDITERKQAEIVLRDREKQLAASQRIAHVGSWEHNLTTGNVVWSDELFRIMGLDPRKDPADFKMFFDMIHPDDRPSLKKGIDETVKTGKQFSVDYRFILRDGRTRILHAQAELLHDETGTQNILSGTGQDITERKEAEDKIRQNEQFIRNILDTVDEGFIVIDRDYRILTANRAYCGQVNRTCDDVIGKHCYETSHKFDRPCYEEGEECAVREVFATGLPHTALHKHDNHGGQVLFVETKGFPVKDASGNVISVIETINNITEKHLLEEERLKTQKLESIGTLAGGIAHDFNNLLQGIFGYISMAKMTYDQKERSLSMLEQAEKALHLSVNLTSQLLTFSKGGKPVRKRISLFPVIENAAKFALSGSRSDFRIDIAPGLWQADADAGQLGQVLQNIVLNADQAMPLGGSVVITARNMSGTDPDLPQGLERMDRVIIEIRDSGVGIAEEYLSKIFDPYFTTKEKGSGLGLATSYSIIKNHGGQIRVRSELGKGSVFSLYLPALAAGDAAQVRSAVPASARKGRVLIMDDEEIVRMVAGELITTLGHEVAFAEHGEAALQAYRDAKAAGRPFDIVILDLTIRGGMGGAETVRKLLEFDPDAKTVVSSGYSDDQVTSTYREHGFRAFLKKPYDVAELQAILNDLLA